MNILRTCYRSVYPPALQIASRFCHGPGSRSAFATRLSTSSTPFQRHFVPHYSPHVETADFPQSTRERIIWPMRHFPHLIPAIAVGLNEVTRQAFFGRELGTTFIQNQLKQTKFLDIYRDKKTGDIKQYIRFDVYENVVGLPVSMGIFKLPGFVNDTRNAFGQLAFRELSDRVTHLNPNPSLLHINCAFSPRGYEICVSICDQIIPDVRVIASLAPCEPETLRLAIELHDSGKALKGDLAELYRRITTIVREQISSEKAMDPNLDPVTTYYRDKMKQSTGIDLSFVEDRSTLIGCLPIPEKIVSSLDAHDARITKFFRGFLNISRGDMLLFYSRISYDELKKKLNPDYTGSDSRIGFPLLRLTLCHNNPILSDLRSGRKVLDLGQFERLARIGGEHHPLTLNAHNRRGR